MRDTFADSRPVIGNPNRYGSLSGVALGRMSASSRSPNCAFRYSKLRFLASMNSGSGPSAPGRRRLGCR